MPCGILGLTGRKPDTLLSNTALCCLNHPSVIQIKRLASYTLYAIVYSLVSMQSLMWDLINALQKSDNH